MKKTVAVIFGTRPDTIKLAPIIIELRRFPREFRVVPIATAQHRHMLDQVLQVFRIRPSHDLNIMRPRQSLASITRNTVAALDDILVREKPDMVLVQGDTLTTFVGSLAAFFRHIPVGHVEAGLRTHDKAQPFPEEMNRRLTSAIADLHFAPTETARRALLREHVDPSTIHITGNSVIDALHQTLRTRHRISLRPLRDLLRSRRRILLVTMHRRENWGDPMSRAARALREIARQVDDVSVVFPVHRNPVVREAVLPVLKSLPNVHLVEPLDYLDFVQLLSHSTLVITDSGGVQEEAPALGKPVLVLREKTERPEAVRFGTVRLVGLDENRIVRAGVRLLTDRTEYRRMAAAVNPYGDGQAAARTVNVIRRFFGFTRTQVPPFLPRARRAG
jgi:UDP-N-acetylglucosamine 2-epimerase (non-hydrolysing)